MKDPMTFIEQFSYKHPHFGIKNLMLYISIANAVFWVLGAVNQTLLSYLSFDAALILRGQVWRLITFMLYPPSTGMLAFIAFYFYYWIGNTLEQYWGTPQFNIYLLIGYRMGPIPYLLLSSILFAAAALLLLNWLDKRGSRTFEELS